MTKNSATMPSGSVAKKLQRHPRLSVRSPPASGPATAVTPNTAPMNPWYLPRCRGGMMSPMIVWDSGMIVPMPRPWMARPTISIQKFTLKPLTTEPTMKTTSPPM